MPEPTLPAIDIAAPTETTPQLHHAVKDGAIETYIANSGRFLEAARTHTPVLEALAEHGFDDEELSIGMALQREALQKFHDRHDGQPPERSAAMEALSERVEKARDDFEAYRLIAKAAFPELSDRVNLRATSDMLEDLQRFINAAHAGYVAASQPPYAEKMTKRGYAPTRLEALLRDIDVLATLDTAQDITEDDENTGADTGDRDRTYLELKDFMKELKGVCLALFRKQPDTLALLKL